MQVAHKQAKQIDDKFLCDLSQAELKTIQVRLNHISLAIGISGITEKAVMDMIVSLLPKYYPRLTINTITKAFIENAAGRLMCRENGKDIEKFIPFNSFDWNFVCNVLNAWEQTEQRKRSEPPKPKATEFQLPPAEKLTMMKADFIVLLKWIKDLGYILPEQANFSDGFLVCKELGLIKPTDFEYQEIVADARSVVTQMCDDAKSPPERREIRSMYEDPETFKNLCRKIYMKQWLQDGMISDENFIDGLISKITP